MRRSPSSAFGVRGLRSARPSFRFMALAAGVGLFGGGVVTACSNSDDAGPLGADPSSSALPEAGAEASGADANGADARLDASDADREVRTCSDENFCHTAVPTDEVLQGVWGDGSGVVWAVAKSGRVHRWDGTAWTVHTTIRDADLRTVWGSGALDVWTAGTTGLWHGTGSDPSSIVFAPVTVPGDVPEDGAAAVALEHLGGTGPNDVWASGGTQKLSYPYEGHGRVAHFDGAAWSEVPLPTNVAWNDVWSSPKTGVWLTGSLEPSSDTDDNWKAVLWRLPVGASDWEEIQLPRVPGLHYTRYPKLVTGAGPSGDDSIWLAGDMQSLEIVYWHGVSADGGKSFTWNYVERDPWDLGLTAFWGLGSADTWAIGEYGRLRHWNGTEWQQAKITVSDYPMMNDLNAIWGISSEDFWVVGNGVALHKTPGGQP